MFMTLRFNYLKEMFQHDRGQVYKGAERPQLLFNSLRAVGRIFDPGP